MRIADDLYAIVLKSMPIACVDLLVTDRDDRVLLLERLNPPARGAWWFPGGRVLRDELRLDAASRKLREECGLQSVKSREVGTFDLLFEEAHGISTVFHLIVEQTDVRLDAQSGRHAWRTRGEWLAEPLHPFVASVLRGMNTAVVRDPNSAFVKQAVKLHHDALSYRSFITSFGLGFLERLYRELLKGDFAFLVVAHEGDQLLGFILACADSTRMMSVVPRNPLAFAPLMIPTIVRHPTVLGKLFQTLFYSSKEATTVKPELVVIAVNDSLRSRGVGAGLVKVLDAELKRGGHAQYKVTVHEAMDGSNRFYLRNGFTLHNTFLLYGVTWNLYLRNVS